MANSLVPTGAKKLPGFVLFCLTYSHFRPDKHTDHLFKTKSLIHPALFNLERHPALNDQEKKVQETPMQDE